MNTPAQAWKELAHRVEVVANSIAFVLPSLPTKQQAALQAIEDELRDAITRTKPT